MLRHRVRFGLFFFLLAFLLLPHTAFGQGNSDLTTGLTGHILVLRNYYTDAHLAFDTDGKLLSSGTRGFGPSEGRVQIEEARIDGGKLVLKADRLIDVYDEATKRLRPVTLGRKTIIEISLPKNGASNDVMAGLLKSIFLTSPETEQLRCTGEEEKAFATRLEPHPDGARSAPIAPKDVHEPQTICYPMGDRAYIAAGAGTKPPKARYSPDPEYPSSALKASATGTVVLMLIVDTEGKPTSFILERSRGYGLDEAALNAVRKWKFHPGQLGDKAAPFAINVQVNFRQ